MRVSKLLVLMLSLLFSLSTPHLSLAKERQVEVTIQFNLNAPADAKDVRLWAPYSVSDENQTIEDIKVKGNLVFIEKAKMAT